MFGWFVCLGVPLGGLEKTINTMHYGRLTEPWQARAEDTRSIQSGISISLGNV